MLCTEFATTEEREAACTKWAVRGGGPTSPGLVAELAAAELAGSSVWDQISCVWQLMTLIAQIDLAWSLLPVQEHSFACSRCSCAPDPPTNLPTPAGRADRPSVRPRQARHLLRVRLSPGVSWQHKSAMHWLMMPAASSRQALSALAPGHATPPATPHPSRCLPAHTAATPTCQSCSRPCAAAWPPALCWRGWLRLACWAATLVSGR